MDSDFYKVNNSIDTYNEAVNIAWIGFEMRHPKDSWPEWLIKCVIVRGMKSPDNKWLIKIAVLPKTKLKPNQHWEEKNGVPVLVETDHVTGKRWMIICGGPAVESKVLFEVEVDLVNESAIVITDTNIELLDGTKYQINRY